MDTAIWVVQVLLAIAFLGAGGTKLAIPYEKYKEQQPWSEDFTPNQIRGIGVLELLAAVGLVLPSITEILPILTPLAAVGLMLTMAGAMYTHIRRNEYVPYLVINAVLFLLALFVAYGRFIAEPIG